MPPTANGELRATEVRLAAPEDYEAVLDINRNVYEGEDYLPSFYHSLVTDPDFRFYVCVVDSEVAAFEGVALLDDNDTLMLRTLRVKDKFQGLGMSAHIRRKIFEDFKDFPGKRRVRQAISEVNRFSKSKTFLSKNRLLKRERRVKFADFDVRLMNHVTANVEDAKPISWEEFGHVINTDSIRNYLYPDGIMTNDFWFYDATSSNINHLKKRCQRVFVTRGLFPFLQCANEKNNESISDGHATTCVDGVRAIGGDRKNATNGGILGIASSYFSPTRLYMVINIAGVLAKGREKEEIASVLSQCLEYVETMYKDDPSESKKLRFNLVGSHDLPVDLIYGVAKTFGLQRAKPEEDIREQYYFEQPFENMIPKGSLQL